MEDMGYGNQPYVVFKHTDIDRVHLHTVSIRVDETGNKLDSNFENLRSMKVCRQIEKDFNLHPATKQEQQAYSIPTKPLNYKEGNVKQQVGNIIEALLNNYKFQSVGEFRTLLEKVNVSVEEVKGLKKGKPYYGLAYSALIDHPTTMKKEKIGTPFKSSLFGKSINMQALEKHVEKWKQQIQDNKTKEYLKPILAKAMQQSGSMDEFKLLLKEKNIEPVFRQNEEGRIYGVSFIDYQNTAIWIMEHLSL
nr:relaxase/mobilization nuclease domain-containing protein [Dysgonomonas massiliensis]